MPGVHTLTHTEHSTARITSIHGRWAENQGWLYSRENPMVKSFLPLSPTCDFSNRRVEVYRNQYKSPHRAQKTEKYSVKKGKNIPQPPNHGRGRVVRYTRPPILPKPKKKHNYRNVVPSVLLHTLGANRNKIPPLPHQYWPKPPPLPTPKWNGWNTAATTVKPHREDDAQYVPLLIDIPREEVTVKNPTANRNEPSQVHDDSPLIDRAIENASTITEQTAPHTPSPFNAEAKSFFPRFDFNPFANSWIPNCLDPFGNIKQCESPTNETIQKQNEIYNIIDPSLNINPQHHAPGSLTIDTSLSQHTYDSEIYNTYSPTTPTFYYPTPTSCDEYSYNEWINSPSGFSECYTGDFETPTYLPDSPTNYPEDAAVDLSLTHLTSGHHTPPAQKSHPGCNDPIDKDLLDTARIISQNVRGWTSSLKFESCIQLMLDNNIEAMCIQETWDFDDYIKTVRGFLVIHHNISENKWKKKPSKDRRGGPRKGVAII